MSISTLVDLAKKRAADQPSLIGYTFISNDVEEETLSYQQLDTKARAIAARLQEMKLTNQRALLLYLPGLDYITAYFGCLYAGVVAVPAYPPDPSRLERTLPRLINVIRDCDAAIILSSSFITQAATGLFSEASVGHELNWLATDEIAPDSAHSFKDTQLSGDSLAFLQYTSGSTSAPRGVMLTHEALMRNLQLMQSALDYGDNPHAVSWLPPYHDMGLIGGILQPLYSGFGVSLMSPMDFLAHPSRWLKVISDKKATASAGPNFAYDLCVRRISETERDSFDLSRWRVAVNGAEPVRTSTIDNFSQYFAGCGFSKKSFFPSYGLAEATLYVTGGSNLGEPTELTVDAYALEKGQIEEVKKNGKLCRTLVGCSSPVDSQILRIVDPDKLTLCPENAVGEIWLKDKSVASGYWGKQELSKSQFEACISQTNEGPFLRTGDLGFLHKGELFITGRLKDMIIVRGSNHYPHDIEASIEKCHPSVRFGCVAVFSLEGAASESVVAVLEVKAHQNQSDLNSIVSCINSAVSLNHDLLISEIAIIEAKSIPKTSSGKIQRHRSRELFLKGTLDALVLWKRPHTVPTVGSHAQDDLVRALADSRDQVAAAQEQSGMEAPRLLIALKQAIAQTMGLELSHLNDQDTLGSLALDSLMKQELLGLLENVLHRRIPVETFVDTLSLASIAEKLSELPTDPMQDGLSSMNTTKHVNDLSADFSKLPEYHLLQEQIAALKLLGLGNPFFTQHEGTARDTTTVASRELINFSNYNYLGLSGDRRVSAAAKSAIDKYGTSVSASRLVSGERPIHELLEKKISSFIGVEDTIVYVSGHATNVTTISHLFGPEDIIFYDSLSHNSIQQGIELSGAKAIPVPHNNWEALDKLMAQYRYNYRRALVVIEGVYSMDGDIPDLPQYIDCKKRHKAFLMVDEAHSIGCLGKTGRGIAEYFGVKASDVDIFMGTMSKSLASCGGYVSGSQALVQYLKYTSPGFVFSVGISPANAGAALKSLEIIEQSPGIVEKLRVNSRLFLSLAKKAGLDTGMSHDSPVIPYIIGNSQRALILSEQLMQRGINARPIVYPAVEESMARLRFFITATHSKKQIKQTVDTLAQLVRGSTHQVTR